VLALGIDRRGVLRYYVSVYYTESIGDWALDRSFENFLSRFGAQFSKGLHSHCVDEFDSVSAAGRILLTAKAGSLAIFIAIRRASSLLSSLAAERDF